MTRIGSLCSGYGGLDMGLASVVGGDTAWLCEYDKHPSTILAERFPGVPNYGDITTTDWSQVEPVDWITAGYPCQPFSHAGKRQGTNDERHIWPHVAECIRLVRPGHVLLENVAGHLSLGFGDVLGDLARLGYDARWGVLRAADVGAPHGRKRVFIVARDADRQRESERSSSEIPNRGSLGLDRSDSSTAPDASGERHGRGQDGRGLGRVDGQDAGSPRQRERAREVAEHRGGEAVADTARNGRDEGWAEPARLERGPDAAERGASAAHPEGERRNGHALNDSSSRRRDGVERGHTDGRVLEDGWSQYRSAIYRWEHILGRPAPAPTEPGRNGPRLAPPFVEWMMGLSAGWVTDIDIPRNAQLKALGNGVVPQQAAAAVRWLTAEAVAA